MVQSFVLLQAVFNALQVGAFYALLATAYVVLHGVTNRFNLAFGALATGVGAAMAAVSASWLDLTFEPPLTILALGVATGLCVAVSIGVMSGALIIRPLMHAAPRVTLIATIALALTVEETVRLITGSQDLWLSPLFPDAYWHWGEAGRDVRVTVSQVVFLLVTFALGLGVAVLLGRNRFGRAWRAIADDPKMARLLGVDVGFIVVVSATLSVVIAGSTGMLVALHYGNIGFANGFMLSTKAMFAACLGGLASPRGALLAGFAVGIGETAWSTFGPLEWRDGIVMSLLVAAVILKEAAKRETV
jgi:branched-chain amino acid transport system permease protein